jgi:hypothetical protein
VALHISSRDVTRVLSANESRSCTEGHPAVSGDRLAGPARASILHDTIVPMRRNSIDGILLNRIERSGQKEVSRITSMV